MAFLAILLPGSNSNLVYDLPESGRSISQVRIRPPPCCRGFCTDSCLFSTARYRVVVGGSDDDVPVSTPIPDVPNSCHRKMNEARTKDVRKTRMHSTNARLSSSPASPYVTRRRYNASGRTWTHAAALLAPHPETLYYYKSQTG